MSEWQDLATALAGNAPIHAGEVYRTFVRAANEIRSLLSDAAAVEHFIKADYSSGLPFSDCYSFRQRYQAIDPEQSGFPVLTASAGQATKMPFMAVSREYLAQVYSAYNRLRRFRITGTLGGVGVEHYTSTMYFSYNTSVVDGYHTLVEHLTSASGAESDWGCRFEISPHWTIDGTDSWRGTLSVYVPVMYFRRTSVVLQAGALLTGGTIYGSDGPASAGAWYECAAQSVTLDPSEWRGELPVPAISDTILATLDPNNSASRGWGCYLFSRDCVVDRMYTDHTQYINMPTSGE